MSSTRPNMSITLPPGFHFDDSDGHLPTTPGHDEPQPISLEPPPPPKQVYKVKRKRAAVPPMNPDILAAQHAIPTIEMSEAIDSSPESCTSTLPTAPSATGLLAPFPHFTRAVSPPKTPAPRLHSIFDQLESPAQEWGLINDSREQRKPFERTGSIGSSFSDSSVSSFGSSAFSTASPESEATDPFMDEELSKHDKLKSAPGLDASSPSAKRAKTHRRAMWTPAMDDHLWMTYMAYLSDPTLTPFKMLPGTAPPLGVCHRVASKAKRTWRDHRTATPTGLMDAILAATPRRRQGSPDTIRPESDADDRDAKQPNWPRSESETRRRLRALCKRRPSLSAHYQRLLRTRSPSPFQSSSSAGRSSEPPSAFSSTDMKLSLITSTNPSMQPDGPLARLASDDLPPRPHSQRTARPADWFSRIGRSQAHQKSLSLQSGLGLDSSSPQKSTSLASPFDEVNSRSHLLQSMSTTKSLGRDFNRAAPFLDSPFEVQGAPTAPRSRKRRFRSDEDKPKRLPLQDVFGPQGESSSSSAVRNRGFSVGASRASDKLAKLFSPPMHQPMATSHAHAPTPSSGQDHIMTEASSDPADVSMLGPPGSRSAPRRLAEPTPRLGSPFMEMPPDSRHFNTFPRSYLPTPDNPQPFQARLQELVPRGSDER